MHVGESLKFDTYYAYDELTRHLEPRLARYKWPRDYVFVETLPRTAYGKVQKALLQDAYEARRDGRPARG